MTYKLQSVSQCNPNFVPNYPGELCQLSSFPSCDHGYDCYNNTQNLNGAPYCQPIINLDTPCNFTDQCTDVGLACIQNLCTPKLWGGEFCEVDEECLSLFCNSNGVCQGLPQGSACVASYDNKCDKGLFCAFNGSFYANSTAAGNCVPSLAEGQPCVSAIGFGIISPRPKTDIASACVAGTLCDINLGVCTRPGTISNQNASNAASCNFQNSAFLDGVGCVDYCGTGLNDPKCTTGYYCSCSSPNTKGSCLPDFCGPQKNTLISCLNTNDCRDVWAGPQFQSLVWRSLSNSTCIYKYCQQQVWDYECCLTNFGTRGDLTPGVSCGTQPTPEPTLSISSTLSSCFLLLLSVIFFVFVVYL